MRHLQALGVVSLLSLVALGACAHADFVPTDTRYVGRPRSQPWVFVDRLPPYPYVSIGIIEVIAPAGTSLAQIFELARQKGSDVGCDVVVDRGIHRITSAIPNAGPPVARLTLAQATYVTPAPTTTVYAPAPPPDRREFICGVASGPPLLPPSEAPPAAPAAPAPPAPPPPKPAPPSPPPHQSPMPGNPNVSPTWTPPPSASGPVAPPPLSDVK